MGSRDMDSAGAFASGDDGLHSPYRDPREGAIGMRCDHDAVLAAIQFPWSNGQVEGHVHRLKLLKRTMYGRAGLELLRRRLIRAA
jgi:transposase